MSNQKKISYSTGRSKPLKQFCNRNNTAYLYRDMMMLEHLPILAKFALFDGAPNPKYILLAKSISRDKYYVSRFDPFSASEKFDGYPTFTDRSLQVIYFHN